VYSNGSGYTPVVIVYVLVTYDKMHVNRNVNEIEINFAKSVKCECVHHSYNMHWHGSETGPSWHFAVAVPTAKLIK
jgi:hypothetical protein